MYKNGCGNLPGNTKMREICGTVCLFQSRKSIFLLVITVSKVCRMPTYGINFRSIIRKILLKEAWSGEKYIYFHSFAGDGISQKHSRPDAFSLLCSKRELAASRIQKRLAVSWADLQYLYFHLLIIHNTS